LFKRQSIQEPYKVISDESHKVLKTVASLGESLHLTKGVNFIYIIKRVLIAGLHVCCALACAYGNRK